MRVTFVSQWYPPERGVTVPLAIVDGLVARGHQVDVLTGLPNYPDGQLHDGYTIRPYRRDQSGRVTIHRASLYPNHSRAAAPRMANYLSFAAGAAMVGATRVPVPDVWLTYSSPATAALPAMLPRRRRHRRPHALIVQDLWPDSVLGSGMASPRLTQVIGRPLAALSQATYRSADSIGVISPGMRQVLTDRGIEPHRILDTPNWVAPLQAPERDVPSLRTHLGVDGGTPIFLYAGNLGEMQSLISLVEAFDRVVGAHLVLIGDGVMRREVEESAATRPHVHVLPPVAAEEVPALQAEADVLVVSLQDTPLLRVTMPSKLQSSMAAGKPILVQGAGDVADVVTKARCGATGSPCSDELRRAVESLASASPETRAELGRRARSWYDDHYSADAGAARVERLLQHAIEEHAR